MKFLKNTRLIVIIGYCVLMILAVTGVLAIYSEMDKASNISKEPDNKLKLVELNNTLNNLYEAEGIAVIMVNVNDNYLYAEYDSLMKRVFEQIYAMKSAEDNPQTILDLDSLTTLLTKRVNNFHSIVNLVNQIENKTINEITNTSIASFGDTAKINNVLANKIHNIQDTTKSAGEKKGFMKRLGAVFKSGNPDTITQVKSGTVMEQIELAVPMISDTLVHYIKETSVVAQKKNAKIISALVARQNEFYLLNEQTSGKIDQIVNQIKDAEYQNSLNVLTERNKSLVKSFNLVVTIGLLALGVTIFFMSWTLKSINESLKLQQKIQEAKKSVDKLLLSREQLIFTITHDIKAPISSILGFLDLLSSENIPQNHQYFVHNMHSSATHILNLVKNLLDFQSLEKNPQQANLLSFSPHTLMEETYDSFLPVVQKKKLNCELKSTVPEDKKFMGDPYQIKQIVNNLISNAVKFTPENGNVTISASIEKDNLFRVSVKDSGPGISQEDSIRIFEAFTRLDETKKTVGGTGLGLAISKKLSTLMQGNIELKSEKGKGSEFIMSIPLSPAKNDIKPSENKPINFANANLDKNIHILFVDDDIVQLNLISELMKRAGLTCVCSLSSLEALKLLEKESFDIVFTDIQMPDMKGFELVDKIRKSSFPNALTIPVIGFSADLNWMEKHPENGFTGFLNKSFRGVDLLNTIEKYTGKKVNYDKTFPKILDLNNLENLLNYVSNDRNAALNLVNAFIEEMETNQNLLKNAFDQKDPETIRQISHKMNSLMNMLSAPEIVTILNLFEKGEQSEEKRLTLSGFISQKISEMKGIRETLKESQRNT